MKELPCTAIDNFRYENRNIFNWLIIKAKNHRYVMVLNEF